MTERREGFDQLMEDMGTIKAQLHILLGNGQPGVIEQHNKRIANLEKYCWGAIGVVSFLEFMHIVTK